jgi:hypothetical protein
MNLKKKQLKALANEIGEQVYNFVDKHNNSIRESEEYKNFIDNLANTDPTYKRGLEILETCKSLSKEAGGLMEKQCNPWGEDDFINYNGLEWTLNRYANDKQNEVFDGKFLCNEGAWTYTNKAKHQLVLASIENDDVQSIIDSVTEKLLSSVKETQS